MGCAHRDHPRPSRDRTSTVTARHTFPKPERCCSSRRCGWPAGSSSRWSCSRCTAPGRSGNTSAGTSPRRHSASTTSSCGRCSSPAWPSPWRCSIASCSGGSSVRSRCAPCSSSSAPRCWSSSRFSSSSSACFLIYTGIRMIRHREDEGDPESLAGMRLLERFMPVSPELDGQRFFTVINGKRAATPLFAALVVVEATDLIFAIDSVPAILALSREEFLIFSSNAFAILGLRAMYFLLADARQRFHYLNHALGAILVFVGLKMAFSRWYHLNVWISLAAIRRAAPGGRDLQRAQEPAARSGRRRRRALNRLAMPSTARGLGTPRSMCSSDIVWFPPQRCPRRHAGSSWPKADRTRPSR